MKKVTRWRKGAHVERVYEGAGRREKFDDPIPEVYPTDEEILWRMKGYLDCLRALSIEGAPDPKYILWMCEKTQEPLVSLTYVEDLRRKLGAQTPEQ